MSGMLLLGNDGTIGCGINDYLKIKFNKLSMRKYKALKIAVAGTGYVGLSMGHLAGSAS